MYVLILLFVTLSHSFLQIEEASPVRFRRNLAKVNGCPSTFSERCICKKQPYPHADSDIQFVVNCTNTRLTDADMLEDLPDETEILIFTGNILNDLPDNIFGFEYHFDKLKYIDFSNNHITFIRGQTFHRVNNVETLILNFNNMQITDRFERHRIFSNFKNLKNLHLTDAFTDNYNASAFYLLKLEDIFIESYLSKIEKLHLEQNEIFSIGKNASIFCPLRSLQHLYISDNKLTDMDFKIECLENLNYIDIRYNMITRLSDDAMDRLDHFVTSGRPLSINMKDNPITCDCRSKNFLHWMKNSGVEIDQVEKYVCMDGYPEENVDKLVRQVEKVSCPGENNGYSSSTVTFLSFLIVFLAITVIVVIYYQKKKISTYVEPLVSNLTSKIGYKGLAVEELPQEVNV